MEFKLIKMLKFFNFLIILDEILNQKNNNLILKLYPIFIFSIKFHFFRSHLLDHGLNILDHFLILFNYLQNLIIIIPFVLNASCPLHRKPIQFISFQLRKLLILIM